MKMEPLPVNFTLADFKRVTPINASNVWHFLLDRNSDRITVKRREVALENLEKIFLATFHLANTVGFRAMTLRDLCRETGLSMGGLYGYIQHKDQLAGMVEDMVRCVTEQLPSWFTHIASPLEEMECILRSHIYLSEIFQPWVYFVFLESRSLQVEQREIAKGSEISIQADLASMIKMTANFSDDQATLLAAHCMSLVQDWHLKRWKFGGTDIDADAFADSVLQIIRSYVNAMSKSMRIEVKHALPIKIGTQTDPDAYALESQAA